MIARVGYHYDAKDNPRSKPEDLKSHYNLPLELKEKRLVRKRIKKRCHWTDSNTEMQTSQRGWHLIPWSFEKSLKVSLRGSIKIMESRRRRDIWLSLLCYGYNTCNKVTVVSDYAVCKIWLSNTLENHCKTNYLNI